MPRELIFFITGLVLGFGMAFFSLWGGFEFCRRRMTVKGQNASVISKEEEPELIEEGYFTPETDDLMESESTTEKGK